jgi:hypothetical protein
MMNQTGSEGVSYEGDSMMRSIRFVMILIAGWITLPAHLFGYSGGTGDPESPYEIATVNDLLQLAATTTDYTEHFVLTADLDLDPNLPGGQVFTSAVIAPDTSILGGYQGTPFKGTLDGNDHVLSNLTIAAPAGEYVGLFGTIRQGQIKNLRLENVAITGCNFVGGLAGRISNSSVSNCRVTGTAVGSRSLCLGGLAGLSVGSTMTDCHSNVAIEGIGGSVGGLAGSSIAGSAIVNCSAAGSINLVDIDGLGVSAGGLVGNNCSSSILQCRAAGDISVSSTSAESASNVHIGGLAGEDRYGTITQSFAAGAIHTALASDSAIACGGGLAGLASSKDFSDNYAEGVVVFNCSAESDYFMGGMIGLNYQGFVRRCYSTGQVDSGPTPEADSCVGGFCGDVITETGYEDTANFWDVDASSKTASAMGLGKSMAQMKAVSTFAGAGWNSAVPAWMMLRQGEDYPRLAWQPIYAGDIAGLYGVDMVDFLYLASYWGLDDCNGLAECGRADIDDSGTVGLGDFASLAADWLAD